MPSILDGFKKAISPNTEVGQPKCDAAKHKFAGQVPIAGTSGINNSKGGSTKTTPRSARSAERSQASTGKAGESLAARTNTKTAEKEPTEVREVLGNCADCEADVYEDESNKGISTMMGCDRCERWFCLVCAGISEADVGVIQRYPNLHWYCNNCNLIATAAVENAKGTTGKKVTLTASDIQKHVVNRVQGILDKMEGKVEAMSQKNKEMQKSFAEAASTGIKRPDIVSESVTRELRDIKQNMEHIRAKAENQLTPGEIQDREARKDNLIIFGIPEANVTDIEERNNQDMERVRDILSTGLKLDTGIVETRRLRSKNGQAPFPLRVKLESEKGKWRVIANTCKLAKIEAYKNVYIKRDMTLVEREEDLLLRKELKEKKAESLKQLDGANWIIRKGKVTNITRQHPSQASPAATQYQPTLVRAPPTGSSPVHTPQAKEPVKVLADVHRVDSSSESGSDSGSERDGKFQKVKNRKKRNSQTQTKTDLK